MQTFEEKFRGFRKKQSATKHHKRHELESQEESGELQEQFVSLQEQ